MDSKSIRLEMEAATTVKDFEHVALCARALGIVDLAPAGTAAEALTIDQAIEVLDARAGVLAEVREAYGFDELWWERNPDQQRTAFVGLSRSTGMHLRIYMPDEWIATSRNPAACVLGTLNALAVDVRNRRPTGPEPVFDAQKRARLEAIIAPYLPRVALLRS